MNIQETTDASKNHFKYFHTAGIVTLAMEQVVNKTDATGGVCWPIPTPKHIRMPKCMGFTPSAFIIGSARGIPSMIIALP